MFFKLRAKRSLLPTLLLPLVLLGGCATTHPGDPFEPVNRAVYKFNDGVDTVLFRPLAQGYRAVLPQFVRTSVSNFFSNINDVLVCLNNLLQGKPTAAYADLGRFLMNSTLGLGGLFDIATPLGVEKNNEDFGQTLGRWGVGGGPYLVLPFLGPSNIRDTVGRAVDSYGDPLRYMNDIRWRNSLVGTRFVNQRAELLDTTTILETAALDEYLFVRDAYLQRRRNLIYDGTPPREKFDENSRLDPGNPLAHAQSPFPSSGDADAGLTGTPWPPVSATPTAPSSAGAAADNTGGGDDETPTAITPVVRVWVSTP
ncbi:MAG: VacJ family lipoprotein [Betaproteobacteria bacterium]|nr:VacJ family lipoprotein [Betaproteobacteria bacterium]